jgi:hypothetical protein
MSLLGRLGPQLTHALEPYMIRCDDHGMQPMIVVCQCLIGLEINGVLVDGVPVARATPDTLLCAEHARLLEEHDLDVEDGVKPLCRACAAAEGLL